MKKLLLVLIVLVSTLAYGQNTFYTRGLEISNKPETSEDFYISYTETDYTASVAIKFNFSYVHIKAVDYELDLKVWETSLHDENDPNKGYNLYCVDKNDEKCILTVSLEEQCIILFEKEDDGSVNAFTWDIKLID